MKRERCINGKDDVSRWLYTERRGWRFSSDLVQRDRDRDRDRGR